jgi:hypothetical protein
MTLRNPAPETEASTEFGDRSKYYARRAQGQIPGEQETQGRLVDSPVQSQTASLFVRRIANAYSNSLQLAVERATRQWNQHVREYLRAETGLRLGTAEAQRSVPVRVVDGLPDPIAEIVASHQDPAEWELYLRRASLAAAAEGLMALKGRYSEIVPQDLKTDATLAQPTDILRVHHLLDALLSRLEKSRIPAEIFGIDHDVLGAYFFHRHEVQLYWMVIAFAAGMLRQPVEALAVVILTHELAHAYTHLGQDIDGGDWETKAFARVDCRVAEGLAQHYARVVCEQRLKERYPAAGEAYRALVACQRGAYKVHESWADPSRRMGEAVRLAMLTTRLQRTAGYDAFQKHLARARETITQQVKPVDAPVDVEIDE